MADKEDVLDQPLALEGFIQVDGQLHEVQRVAQLLHTPQLLGAGAQHSGAGQKVEGGFVRIPRRLVWGPIRWAWGFWATTVQDDQGEGEGEDHADDDADDDARWVARWVARWIARWVAQATCD